MSAELYDVLFKAFIFKAIGGLGIFLLGMKYMSEGMQAVAGKRLRELIHKVTNKRVIACLVGTFITCIVQSSSVTTVMVIGFVNGGFMTLVQAIGVIIGANIGTTITGWILVLKIGKWGLPILGIASFVYLFARKDRLRFMAMTIMGIGMVFFGLETMASGFKHPEVRGMLTQVFSAMSGATYLGVIKCAIVGCVATMIVQSSSATLGVTIALAQSGVVNFETAAALIFGLNIGTTITAFLASLGTTTNAKRAAYAHIAFNIIGTLWILPFFFPYTRGIAAIVDSFSGSLGLEGGIVSKIALTHTGFNVVNTLVFLPLLPLLARVVSRLVPEKDKEETPHLTYLDIRMLETPAIAVEQSADEIYRMGDHVIEMSTMLRSVLTSETPDDETVRRLFHREEILDVVQKEVTEFVSNLMSGNVAHDVIDAGREQLRMADEYESISDYYTNILKFHLKKRENSIQFSAKAMEDTLNLHDHVHEYLLMVNEGVKSRRPEVLTKARSVGDEITHHMKDARTRYLDGVSGEGGTSTPLTSLVLTDMLNAYRRVKDHTLNIAEALAGEK